MDVRKNRYRSDQWATSRPLESKNETLRDQAMGNRLRTRGGTPDGRSETSVDRCTSGEYVFVGTAKNDWKALGSTVDRLDCVSDTHSRPSKT